jgi:hypothetical protein
MQIPITIKDTYVTGEMESIMSRRRYTKGVWASMGPRPTVNPALIANKGIVGVMVSEDWNVIETSDGVYNWAPLDAKIAAAKAAGFKNLVVAVTWSSQNTPEWLTNSLPQEEKIPLRDPGRSHPFYCHEIWTPLYWGETYHNKRLALIAAFGARYRHDSAIKATPCSFANHNSMDWNVSDNIGTLTNCPDGIPDQDINQPEQWLEAGWTFQKMLQVGKDMCDAVADAFRPQCIKLPIGGFNKILQDDPIGSGNGTYSSLARAIMDYVATRPYADRFYISRNSVVATWQPAQELITHPPGFDSDKYIRKMVLDASPLSGLQTFAAATNGEASGCVQNNGISPCVDYTVFQNSLNVMLTFSPTFIEVWTLDAQNTAFYDLIRAATITLGGTPRP